jgi:hypothetical protein
MRGAVLHCHIRQRIEDEIMSTTQSITSIGHACCVLQRPFATIERAIAVLNIKPACHINGVAHLDDADVERIAKHLDGESK